MSVTATGLTPSGKRGPFRRGFRGLLLGPAFFVRPAFGPVMVVGPLAAWIV